MLSSALGDNAIEHWSRSFNSKRRGSYTEEVNLNNNGTIRGSGNTDGHYHREPGQ